MTQSLLIRSFGLASAAVPLLRIHLHGSIITPDGFIQDGTIVVENGTIREVHEVRTPARAGDINIDSGGLMCPGFIDTHNHASYAAFQRWQKPARYFRGRFDWRGKTRCGVVVVPEPDDYYKTKVSAPYRAIVDHDPPVPNVTSLLTYYGQLRGLIGGATTMVVDADLDPDDYKDLPGLSRDPSDWPGRVWGILDVGCVDDKVRLEIVDDLKQSKAKLLVHCGEGVDEFSRGEFLSLDMKGLLTRHTALIHAMALLDADWQLVKRRGASVIWSPQSNFRLYGRSIDIGQVLGWKIPVALAPDWTITGSSTVLDELAFVRRRYGWIPDQTLLAMVTTNAADIMGMPLLGRLQPGALADILVFQSDGSVVDRETAASAVVTATPADLRLAMVGGVAMYGTEELMREFPDDGTPAEQLELPLVDGRYVPRILRDLGGWSYAKSSALINQLLTEQGLTIAPLWEPEEATPAASESTPSTPG